MCAETLFKLFTMLKNDCSNICDFVTVFFTENTNIVTSIFLVFLHTTKLLLNAVSLFIPPICF